MECAIGKLKDEETQILVVLWETITPKNISHLVSVYAS